MPNQPPMLQYTLLSAQGTSAAGNPTGKGVALLGRPGVLTRGMWGGVDGECTCHTPFRGRNGGVTVHHAPQLLAEHTPPPRPRPRLFLLLPHIIVYMTLGGGSEDRSIGASPMNRTPDVPDSDAPIPSSHPSPRKINTSSPLTLNQVRGHIVRAHYFVERTGYGFTGRCM